MLTRLPYEALLIFVDVNEIVSLNAFTCVVTLSVDLHTSHWLSHYNRCTYVKLGIILRPHFIVFILVFDNELMRKDKPWVFHPQNTSKYTRGDT